MKNALVLNLTRFGDLLQTQPAIHGLNRRGFNVGVVCLTPFTDAARLLSHTHAVFPFPDAALLADLDRNWPDALARLHAWRAELFKAFKPDYVLNITATLSARLLARLLTEHGAELAGFGVDSHGFGTSSGPWTTFLQASTQQRSCSPYNLTDLFRKVGNVFGLPASTAILPPSEKDRGRAETLLRENAPEGDTGRYAALQLGASDERRQWPVEYFARLGTRLWREAGLTPVLFGASGERPLAERYIREADSPCVNLTGKTNLPELAAALRRCELLITNDTGTMHLAAAVGTPVLALFLATAQPWDTGPYSDGCLCLEPDMPCHPCGFDAACPHAGSGKGGNPCRFKISPDTVFGYVRAWLDNGAWSAASEKAVETESRAWVTLLDRNNPDFIDLRSINGHDADERTLWIRAQRGFLKPFLDNGLEGAAMPPELPAPLRESVAPVAERSAALLHLLAEQGAALSKAPVPVLKKRFLATWQKLETLWSENPRFIALAHLWLCETQDAGDNLETVLAIARRYRNLMLRLK